MCPQEATWTTNFGMSMLMLLNNLCPNLCPGFDTATDTLLTSYDVLLVQSSDSMMLYWGKSYGTYMSEC